jgi:hypothetical protein
MISERTSVQRNVGMSSNNQATRRMPVADVDHGNETATAIVKQSARRASRVRSMGYDVKTHAMA